MGDNTVYGMEKAVGKRAFFEEEILQVFVNGEHAVVMGDDRLEYQKLYCGHYHTEKSADKLEIMFENFDVF